MDLKNLDKTATIKSITLQACLDIITETLKAERGFISLKDPHDDRLNAHAVCNLDAANIFYNVEISQSVINMAYREGKPVIISDALSDPRFSETTSVVLSELRSVLCVPIMDEGGVAGIIYVDNRMKAGVFEQENLDFLTSCARRLGDLLKDITATMKS
jgi:adenylate cyclase